MTHVAIPSHGRAELLNRTTLQTLAAGGIEPDDVRIFVAPDEIPEYIAQLDKALYAEVVPGRLGLRQNTNAITEYYPAGERVVHIEDDVEAVWLRDGPKAVLSTEHDEVDLNAVVAEGFDLCTSTGATLWGVYPVANPYFMHDSARFGVLFCIGQLFGVVNQPDLLITIDAKTDYERTLLHAERAGLVVRLDHVTCKSRMYRAGGQQRSDFTRRAANEAGALALLERFPGLVARKPKDGPVGAEIRLVNPRSFR